MSKYITYLTLGVTLAINLSLFSALECKIHFNKRQISLQGDRIIFTEDSKAPGIPVIYRIDEERRANPDKLNLDRY